MFLGNKGERTPNTDKRIISVRFRTLGTNRSAVRFSSLGDQLLLHSAHPTTKLDSIFFGPDTYRFASAIRTCLSDDPAFLPETIVDIGAGTGAGGLLCASLFPDAKRIILSDINEQALQFSALNAALNGIEAEFQASDVLNSLDGKSDLIISNPPYLVDAELRAYRHGGGSWGCDLAVRILKESMLRLTSTGRLLLYTGTPIVGGRDMFLKSILPYLERTTKAYRYEEMDPDVFGRLRKQVSISKTPNCMPKACVGAARSLPLASRMRIKQSTPLFLAARPSTVPRVKAFIATRDGRGTMRPRSPMTLKRSSANARSIESKVKQWEKAGCPPAFFSGAPTQ